MMPQGGPPMPPKNALTLNGPPPDDEMTGPSPDDHDPQGGPDDQDQGDDAPSPEMVSAGVKALTSAPPGAKPEEIVAQIYQAMESAEQPDEGDAGDHEYR